MADLSFATHLCTFHTDYEATAVGLQAMLEGLGSNILKHLGNVELGKSLRVFLQDEQGKVVGGIAGDLFGGWVYISLLWVDEALRNQGYGGELLQRLRQDEPRLPRPKPRPADPLRRAVPMGRIPWDQPQPGHFEVDLVHHCGPSASGEYIHTLQLIDVRTGWSERWAVLGRSYRVMQAAFQGCLARLPFPIIELHPDNGSEFFNQHLVRFWARAVPDLHWSRSRPYHKNDNRFVEQKNYTLVRAYLAYRRFDTVAQTHAINHLYELMGLYYNLFQPVMEAYLTAVAQTVDGMLPASDTLTEAQDKIAP